MPTPAATASEIADAISSLVIDCLDEPTKNSLRAYHGGAAPELQESLVKALNYVVENHEIWKQAPLDDKKVVGLLQTPPPPDKSISDLPNEDKLRLNRTLLFTAFPHYIASWVVKLNGANFRPDSVICIDGEELTDGEKAQFVNSETLKFKLKRKDSKGKDRQPGPVSVLVINPKRPDRPADDDGHSEAFSVELP